ncbi:MAG: hypothetical protein AB1499_03905 [Nitrospirota bacterium]
MIKKIFTGILTAGMILIACISAEAGGRGRAHSVPFGIFTPSDAHAGDERNPYGRPRKGQYGEKSAIINEAEAHRILGEYFQGDVKIGRVRERKFYFESEIRDRNGNLIDKVIIDKRTGRIRSIY